MAKAPMEFVKYFHERTTQCRRPVCACSSSPEGASQKPIPDEKGIWMMPGKQTPSMLMPWTVAVGRPGKERFLLEGGGVFIRPDIVITADHVTDGMRFAGPVSISADNHNIHNGRWLKALDVISTFSLRELDLSLIRLDPNEVDESKSHYVDIIDSHALNTMIDAQSDCLVAGWGVQKRTSALTSDNLFDVAMHFSEYTNREKVPDKGVFSVQSGCNKGPCTKDSGSGLFVLGGNGEPKLAGIASAITGGNTCHSNQQPALYANVGLIREEIMWLASRLSAF